MLTFLVEVEHEGRGRKEVEFISRVLCGNEGKKSFQEPKLEIHKSNPTLAIEEY